MKTYPNVYNRSRVNTDSKRLQNFPERAADAKEGVPFRAGKNLAKEVEAVLGASKKFIMRMNGDDMCFEFEDELTVAEANLLNDTLDTFKTDTLGWD